MKRVGLAMTRWPALFAADIDIAVIRISHEAVATTLKFAIQFVQYEIRE
jgi:hypothetical protein